MFAYLRRKKGKSDCQGIKARASASDDFQHKDVPFQYRAPRKVSGFGFVASESETFRSAPRGSHGGDYDPPWEFIVHAPPLLKIDLKRLRCNGLRAKKKVLTSMDIGGILPHEVSINERRQRKKIERYDSV